MKQNSFNSRYPILFSSTMSFEKRYIFQEIFLWLLSCLKKTEKQKKNFWRDNRFLFRQERKKQKNLFLYTKKRPLSKWPFYF